tara:strand:- start:416 stop:700 length:285 start_codon:yes stop_codon:yes gene_type:complete
VTYRALPEGLFISDSTIAGQGVFTRKSLDIGTELGISHIIDGKEMHRTPLGGFLNHSEVPNCKKYRDGMKYYVKVIRPIAPMEELFLKYTFYRV